MKKTAVNPYLPFWETVPDGEPDVFGHRLYIFGSHDKLKGTAFCEDNYVGWSASINDLGNWRYEGVIYKKEQDPINGAAYEGVMPQYETSPFDSPEGHNLYAPDVVQGADGRYYLFYALDFVNVISVAVCDTPVGAYQFHGYVMLEDGTLPSGARFFDPAVIRNNAVNYLYYGFCPSMHFPGMDQATFEGAMMVKLSDDMHTIISEPVCVAKGIEGAKNTSYEAHPFFEAPSIRKIGEWYYFVYSSLQGHELCYGMAKSPEGPFEYKGVIVSNGDVGYQENKLAVNYVGNNHGGLEVINGKTYIFWHRHTHGTPFSRQGCADEVKIRADGTIPQIEITSCGLNGDSIPSKEKYGAYIACQVTPIDRKAVGRVPDFMPGEERPVLPKEMPYIMEEEWAEGDHQLRSFITNLNNGGVAGVKYLLFDGDEKQVSLLTRGKGEIQICMDEPDGEVIGETKTNSDDWEICTAEICNTTGIHAIYFVVTKGRIDFSEFEFMK